MASLRKGVNKKNGWGHVRKVLSTPCRTQFYKNFCWIYLHITCLKKTVISLLEYKHNTAFYNGEKRWIFGIIHCIRMDLNKIIRGVGGSPLARHTDRLLELMSSSILYPLVHIVTTRWCWFTKQSVILSKRQIKINIYFLPLLHLDSLKEKLKWNKLIIQFEVKNSLYKLVP